MRIGLLSDTHGFLDDAVFVHFAECDEIWHAGDVGSAEVLDRLSEAKPVRAVFGNIDGPEMRSRLPADIDCCVQEVRVYITHIGGYPGRYEPGVREQLAARRPALFVCGHSHVVRVMRDPKLGLLHVNPGAAGHSGWHRERTLMRFTLGGGKISDLELIQLGPRGRKLGPRP